MFWQCKYATSSRIDEILEDFQKSCPKEDDNEDPVEPNDEDVDQNAESDGGGDSTKDGKCLSSEDQEKVRALEISSLLELLNEDDLLQEVRTKNQQLLNFLCRPSVLNYMISQIVNEPVDEEVELYLRFKKPSVISEILSSCTDQICNCLVEEKCLEHLFTLIRNSNRINPLQASFFAKVVTSLFPNYASQVSSFLGNQSHIITSLVDHIDNSAFADVIMRIVTFQENDSVKEQILGFVQREKLVLKLITSLGQAADNQAKMNSAMVLEDLIRLSRDHLITSIGHDQTDLSHVENRQCAFLRDILSKDAIELLLLQISDNSDDNTTVGFTIKLFVSMITAKPMALSLAGASEEFPPSTLVVLNQTISLAFQQLVPVFEPLANVFKNPPHQEPLLLTSLPTPQTPLGWVRLEIAEFVFAVIDQFATNVAFYVEQAAPALVELIKSSLMSQVIESFFLFTSNNILHGLIVKLLRSYLSLCTALKTSSEQVRDNLAAIDLEKCLFSDTCLLSRLIETWESYLTQKKVKSESLSPDLINGCNQGNFGHVVIITDEINRFVQTPDTLLYLSEDQHSKWSTIKEELTRINKDYEKPLGGTNPNKYSTDDDEQTNVILSFNEEPALQKAFVEYTTQEMTMDTSQFESLTGPRDLDEFFSGRSLPIPQFNPPLVSNLNDFDQERGTSVFESLCEQRLNTFKGLDDDEGSQIDMEGIESTTGSRINQFMANTFDSKFNEVFSSPDDKPRHVATTQEASSPFLADDPFASSPFSSPNSKSEGFSTQSEPFQPFGSGSGGASDPFGTADDSLNSPSNWADFANFAANATQSSPNKQTGYDQLVLQSVDSGDMDDDPFKPSSDETPAVFANPPPALVAEDDVPSELSENFNFLSSSGLAKTIASETGGDDSSSNQ